MAYVQQLLRPHQIFHPASHKFFPAELVRSPVHETISVASIIGVCYVLDLQSYCLVCCFVLDLELFILTLSHLMTSWSCSGRMLLSAYSCKPDVPAAGS